MEKPGPRKPDRLSAEAIRNLRSTAFGFSRRPAASP